MAKLLQEFRPRGLEFVQCAMAIALRAVDRNNIDDLAAYRWGVNSLPHRMALKAAVPALGGADITFPPGWQTAASEFIAAVLEQSVIGRLRGTRRVPLDLPHGTASGATAAWVGEGAPIPLSVPALEAASLPPKKVGALVVSSIELLQKAGAKMEALLRTDLLKACSDEVDVALLDGGAASAVRPASLTAGLTPVTSTADPGADLAAVIAAFGGDLTQAVWILNPVTAAALSGIDRPNIGLQGGELLGAPAVTSRGATIGEVILVDPAGLLLAEGSAEISASRHASIEMTDAPLNTSTGANPVEAALVSMFQTNAVAIRATMTANWAAARPGSVALIEGVGV